VHRGELHGEWCSMDVTGGLNGKRDMGFWICWETVDCRTVHSCEFHSDLC